MNALTKQVLVLMAAIVLLSPFAAAAQQPSASTIEQPAMRRTIGIVTSARRGSIVVRTDDGQFLVFVVDRDTQRAKPIQTGERVSVVTTPNDTGTPLTALAVDVLPGGQAPAAATDAAAIPPEIRRLEAQIERQVRRYRVGAFGGVALDPELISVGAHATFGPIFNRNVVFRPNLELGFGEVTTLVALHLDVLYNFPGATRQTRWAPYVGAGPNFSFSHRGFESEEDGNRFDFGDFDADSGFDFIAGARNPNGVFIELKATASGVANVRLLAGFNF
ncbi:MAG: hypothetical protein LC791_20055 [Acidobacteria bacterium]|nr:hypothetical protein [Acidobacteriota bacterium]